jgi:cobalamin transport system ATP-binding protein
MIELDGVRFGYGARAILDGLSLTVPRGQLLGVIGPNGAGKTTLVRLLLGLARPTAGRVLVAGREVERWPRRELARRVAAVTQEEALEFPFTALEVVLMGRIAHLGPFGFERAADLEAAERAMRETGVETLASRPLDELSGGERKRVLLARAFAQEPELLVLDEPAAALDLRHQIAIFELLAERRRRGVTVVVVVHDLNLAAAYCDRVLLLRSGEPALVGSIEEVLTYARVKEAFGVDVYVGVNEVTGARFLIPMAAKRSGD